MVLPNTSNEPDTRARRIPKGFRSKAQGADHRSEAKAGSNPGSVATKNPNPNGVAD